MIDVKEGIILTCERQPEPFMHALVVFQIRIVWHRRDKSYFASIWSHYVEDGCIGSTPDGSVTNQLILRLYRLKQC